MSSADRYADALRSCHENGTYRTIPNLRNNGKQVVVDGSTLINLNSNDYLGLLDSPALFHEFIETHGSHLAPSSASSRLLTGNDDSYRLFESEIAKAYRRETALLWDSGYHANSGILPVIALPNTLFIADKWVHASIIDGIRLSGIPYQRFRHNDLSHLQKILQRYAQDYQTIWLITESLFSMDGDRAPLMELIRLKEEYPQLHLYVDEAHAVGVFGEQGLGIAESLDIVDKIDVIVGTLGKALGSQGAYSLQSQTLRELFVSQARPLIFSTALPPFNIAWSHFIFNKVRNMGDRRVHLLHLIELFNREMNTAFPSQIIPIILPGDRQVNQGAELFRQHGYYVRPIRKPTVPAGTERLRISLTSAMTDEEIIHITELCRRLS